MSAYKVEHTETGMRYRYDRKGARWDFVKYAASRLDACDDCGKLLPAKSMHYAHLPIMDRGKRGDWQAFRSDPINMMSTRFVCLGCSNRYRALDERLRQHREIAALIRKLEKEARRDARPHRDVLPGPLRRGLQPLVAPWLGVVGRRGREIRQASRRSRRMTFDPTKPVQTRDGRAARIICSDARLSWGAPLVALVQAPGRSGELIEFYDAEGRAKTTIDGSNDLINAPEKGTRWVGVWRRENGSILISDDGATKADADEYARNITLRDTGWRRIACKPVEFTEGEGLDAEVPS